MQSFYPKISIITPVKNAENAIGKAIDSLIRQNYPNLEYIVIDGNSSDGTDRVIEKYKKYITHYRKNNLNAVEAEIQGIEIATGEIIAFLNADDFYEPGILSRVAEEFNKDSDLDLVSSLYRVLNKNDEILYQSNLQEMDLDKNKIIISYGMNARFFKKNIFEKYKKMITKDQKNRVFLSNDVEHLIRILLKGINNKTIDFVGYNYLAHDSSNTFSGDVETKTRLLEDKLYIASIFLQSTDIDLPKIWKKTFKKWTLKCRAKIVAKRIKQGKIKIAVREFKEGVKDNGLFKFSFYLIKTFFRKL